MSTSIANWCPSTCTVTSNGFWILVSSPTRKRGYSWLSCNRLTTGLVLPVPWTAFCGLLLQTDRRCPHLSTTVTLCPTVSALYRRVTRLAASVTYCIRSSLQRLPFKPLSSWPTVLRNLVHFAVPPPPPPPQTASCRGGARAGSWPPLLTHALWSGPCLECQILFRQ